MPFLLHHHATSYKLGHHHNRFMAIVLGPPGWAGARKKLLLDFMVLGRITRGRHTDDNLGGRHSIWTNQQSTSINPSILCQMPCLPYPPNLSWLRTGTGICWIAYPRGLVTPRPVKWKPKLVVAQELLQVGWPSHTASTESKHWTLNIQ